jgi:hypothetical protein
MQLAQLGGSMLASYEGAAMLASIGAARAVRAAWAIVMGAKVHCLAAEGAAVVDEFLALRDGHFVG